MSPDTNDGLGRWRGARPTPSGPSRTRIITTKWLRASILTALLAVAALTLVYIFWLISPVSRPTVEFVPLIIADFDKQQVPPLPWAEADRRAFQEAQLFEWRPPEPARENRLTRDVAREILKRLQQKQTSDSAVVYIAARALVDSSGAVQIVAADSDPYASNMLPLEDVVASLKACPARNKLLVLDLMSVPFDPFDLQGTSDGVADLARDALASKGDPGEPVDSRLLVLFSCSPGESPLWSETLHQSVFGYYFAYAFSDPEADIDDDRALSVKNELIPYLVEKVDRWARQHRGVRQRLSFVGTPPSSFLLATVRPRRPQPQLSDLAAEQGRETKKTDETEKAPAKDKAAESSKETDKIKKADVKPASGTEKEKDAAVAPESTGPVYPQWLTKFWELRDAWQKSGDFQAAPRVFRRLEATLSRAEQAWRSGSPPEDLVGPLADEVRILDEDMKRFQSVDRPPVRSVGQARAYGQTADPVLVNGLKPLFENLRKPVSSAPPGQINKELETQMSKFLDTLKGKKAIDLAKAIDEATRDERFDDKMVQLLDAIVADSALEFNVLELRVLRQLAQRAKAGRAGDWDQETAKMIWNTVLLAEEVNHRPLTWPSVRPLLDEADSQRREAEVLLLQEAIGFASPAQFAASWQRVQKLYTDIDEFERRIRDARRLLDLARATLPAYVAYLEAAGNAESEIRWLETARTAVDLGRLLQDSSKAVENPDAATRKLESDLAGLLRRFQPRAIDELVRRTAANQPEPSLGREVEALLATPFLAASDRAKLWSAGRALDRRLGELAPKAAAAPPETNRAQAAGALVARRKKRAKALLELARGNAGADRDRAAPGAGPEKRAARRSAGEDGSPDLDTLERVWSEMAAAAQALHGELSELVRKTERADADDRPGWIAQAFALDLDANPIRESRKGDDAAAQSWLAGRYRHVKGDLHENVEPGNFYEQLALERAGAENAPREPALGLSLAEGAMILSGKNATVEAAFQLDLKGAGDAAVQPVTVKVLKPEDARLRVSEQPPAELNLTPDTPRRVTFRVEWDDAAEPGAGPLPKGVIVQARLRNQLPYHLLVPLSVVEERTRPRLVLTTDPDGSIDVRFGRLPLRTVPGRQNFFLFVRNPSDVAHKVIVEFLDGTTQIAVSGSMPPLEVKPKSVTRVESLGPPKAKEAEPPRANVVEPPKAKETEPPLPKAPRALTLRLRNAAGNDVFDEQKLEPAIAAPLDYVEVIGQPRFIPARPPDQNRLEITLRPLRQFTGPAGRIKLTIPADKTLFPQFVEPPSTGSLEQPLERGGRAVTLSAQGIKLDSRAESEEGHFHLTIDGIERGLWYKAKFAGEGENGQVAERDLTRRVRFDATPDVKQGQDAELRVAFRVDNAPPDAQLEFHLGQNKGEKFADELRVLSRPAKRRYIGFAPAEKGGALQFEAREEDWKESFTTTGIRGPKRLQAFLIDPRTKNQLDSWGMDLVLDDLPPENPLVEGPPQVQVRKGATLAVKATVTLPQSGIKKVEFLVGSREDFGKPENAARIAPGKPREGDPLLWEATLPLPTEPGDEAFVTARVTSGYGLTALASSAPIKVLPAVPSPADAAAAQEPPKPGAIKGKVTSLDIIQAGLEVVLVGPKAKDAANQVKKTTKTKPDGTYEFPDLEPGVYQVECKRADTGRSDKKEVTVPSGQTVQQDLDLLLP
jgi:hypothetical protein